MNRPAQIPVERAAQPITSTVEVRREPISGRYLTSNFTGGKSTFTLEAFALPLRTATV